MARVLFSFVRVYGVTRDLGTGGHFGMLSFSCLLCLAGVVLSFDLGGTFSGTRASRRVSGAYHAANILWRV